MGGHAPRGGLGAGLSAGRAQRCDQSARPTTASIDSGTEALLQEALHALKGEVSMVIIAHRLSTLREADEILVLARGRLQERGTHDALIARGGLYRRLWELQRMEAGGRG